MGFPTRESGSRQGCTAAMHALEGCGYAMHALRGGRGLVPACPWGPQQSHARLGQDPRHHRHDCMMTDRGGVPLRGAFRFGVSCFL